ncbi:hypothetical protein G5C51_40710 [Streptomyces sp. A7024]|uniref:Uncharacterized protein n=1 Tax=Streptomyces coryli TaxID=1128680 RepID=A0A6G4UDG8_9ACTN|nr:hypothetical protein [Streptomyces coryli]NGN70193.1 hypothetical protein [Streptomyces coryli]
MDIRVKTFAAEAASRMDAALGGLGFTGPEVNQGHNTYPLVITVRYHRSDVSLKISLILTYAGEEYVSTTLQEHREAPQKARRVEVGTNTAHTGYQMRRALEQQAQAVSDRLRHPDQHD